MVFHEVVGLGSPGVGNRVGVVLIVRHGTDDDPATATSYQSNPLIIYFIYQRLTMIMYPR